MFVFAEEYIESPGKNFNWASSEYTLSVMIFACCYNPHPLWPICALVKTKMNNAFFLVCILHDQSILTPAV
jgi:hypothetical protein